MKRWIIALSVAMLAMATAAADLSGDGAAEARKFLASQQYEEAAEAATAALERNTADSEARLTRARALTALGRYEAALWDVEALLRAEPKQEYYFQRAMIHVGQGRVADGIADLVRAAEQDRDEVDRAVAKAGAQMMFFPNQAMKTLNDAIVAHPKEPRLFFLRSGVQLRRKDFERALADARAARDVAPDDPQFASAYANTFLMCDRTHLARDEATTALKRFPQYGNLYGIRGRANLAIGRTDEATTDALRYLQFAPTSSQPHLLLARCRVASKRYGEAMLDYLTSAEFARKERVPGECERVWAELSRLLSRCPDDAVRDGAQALKLAQEAQNSLLRPSDEMDTLASAYAELGQFNKAVEAQQQAVNWAKNSPDFKPLSERLELYKQGKPYRESKFEH